MTLVFNIVWNQSQTGNWRGLHPTKNAQTDGYLAGNHKWSKLTVECPGCPLLCLSTRRLCHQTRKWSCWSHWEVWGLHKWIWAWNCCSQFKAQMFSLRNLQGQTCFAEGHHGVTCMSHTTINSRSTPCHEPRRETLNLRSTPTTSATHSTRCAANLVDFIYVPGFKVSAHPSPRFGNDNNQFQTERTNLSTAAPFCSSMWPFPFPLKHLGMPLP
jgi:hypothetical protein